MKTKLKSKNTIDLWLELVRTSFKMRYQNSILGFLWVLIKPYAMFAIMFFIFSNIIRANVDNYALYLLSGVVFFTFINELLILGQMSLLERGNIILKVNFPRYVAIISALTGAFINLLINLALILVISMLLQIPFLIINGVVLFVTIVVCFIWAIGIAFLSSIATIYIRDLKNIFELGLFLMQYATPIFYVANKDLVPSQTILNIILLNPLTFLMNQFRAGIGVYGEPQLLELGIFLLIGLVFSYLAYLWFISASKKVAEYF